MARHLAWTMHTHNVTHMQLLVTPVEHMAISVEHMGS